MMMANVQGDDVRARPSPMTERANGVNTQSSGKRKPDQNDNYSDFDESGSVSSDIDLKERLRQSESEKIAVIMDHNEMMRKCNERINSYLHEIHLEQEHSRALQSDLDEMRELSCYLDDDRRNCRRVAKEWQRFGRYTVTIMRNEVISYSEKLRTLEAKQTDLMRENGELRDLCVYLDKSRRSDNRLSDDEQENLLKFVICSECKKLRKDNEETELIPAAPGLSVDKTNGVDQSNRGEYVNKLEARIKQLEEERDFFITTFSSKKTSKDKKRVSFSVPEDDCDSSSLSEQDRSDMDMAIRSPPFKADSQHGILRNGFLSPPPRRDGSKMADMKMDSTDRVTQAMRVLEIQEKLERGSSSSTGSEEPLTEPEVAILKQMCSAAWSKLGDDQFVPLPSSLLENNVNGDFRPNHSLMQFRGNQR